MKDSLSVERLQEMLERGEPVTVLDVRQDQEWAEWAIPTSLHADAYQALKAKDPDGLNGIQLPQGRPVVTV